MEKVEWALEGVLWALEVGWKSVVCLQQGVEEAGHSDNENFNIILTKYYK